MSYDLQADALLVRGIDFLKQVILSCGGSCRLNSLHGHFGRTSARQLRRVLGRNPNGLTMLLKSLPKDFALAKLDDGELIVSLPLNQHGATTALEYLSWIMRDCDCMSLDHIVKELRRADRHVQELVGTTNAGVRAFLERHPKEFFATNYLVWRCDEAPDLLDPSTDVLDAVVHFIEQRIEKRGGYLSIVDLVVDITQLAPQLLQVMGATKISVNIFLSHHPDRFVIDDGFVFIVRRLVLPVHHRGQLKRVEKMWGIIRHGPPKCDIFFGRHVLVTNSKAQDMTTILHAGCSLDCLIVPAEAKSEYGLKYTAIRVWTVEASLEGGMLASAPLHYPLLCGKARVAYCDAGVGFLTLLHNDQLMDDDKAKVAPELVMFNLQHCIVPYNVKVTAEDQVNFLATSCFDNKVRYKLWDCVRMWSSRPSEPMFPTFTVSATLGVATRTGGCLTSDTDPGTMPFHWETVIDSHHLGGDCLKPMQFSANQQCVVTLSASTDMEDQVIVSLQPKDSLDDDHELVARKLGSENASERPRNFSQEGGYSSSSSHSSHFCGRATPEVLKGLGHIISNDVFGGVVKSVCGTIVAFGPHCFYYRDKPACASFFPDGTAVCFEAVVKDGLAEASKVWVDCSE